MHNNLLGTDMLVIYTRDQISGNDWLKVSEKNEGHRDCRKSTGDSLDTSMNMHMYCTSMNSGCALEFEASHSVNSI